MFEIFSTKGGAVVNFEIATNSLEPPENNLSTIFAACEEFSL